MESESNIFRERIIYSSILALLAIVTVMMAYNYIHSIRVSKVLRAENETLTANAHVLTEKLTRSNAIIEDLTKSFPGLRPETVDEFRRRGLSDPQNDIITDLGSREELMPFQGIFGARPSFYTDVRMYVLNSRWAYASFDDGSRLGQTLLEYTVSERGAITWKVIDKAVFESR